MVRLYHAIAVLALASFTFACGGESSEEGNTITVFAAASLTESFTKIGQFFETEHPGTHVVFNFGSSSELAKQIQEGAPVDVFASADSTAMTQALDGLPAAGSPVIFARNRAEIAVEPGNPLGIEKLSDLETPDLIVVVCAPDVPCGRYTDEVLKRSQIDIRPASLEPNVKSVVSKVALGEADAGIVYHSDVITSGGKINGVEIPAAENVVADYPIVAIDPDDPSATTAATFVDYVTSARGQQILKSQGFTTRNS